ncbi:MAG: hypothetical protein M1820_001916 [Bogoriella megaspora]|nr:MAG: hypothetical protein M1820_001916 [Bogoriella megaspora]
MAETPQKCSNHSGKEEHINFRHSEDTKRGNPNTKTPEQNGKPYRRAPPTKKVYSPLSITLRSATRRKRETFPFLSLPPEIRNFIYSYSLSFDGISAWLEKSSRVMHDHAATNEPTAPTKATPAILLLNRQITAEAQGLLYATKTLHLSYGIPKPDPENSNWQIGLAAVVSPHVICRVEHIVYTGKDLCGTCVKTHHVLLKSLAEILRGWDDAKGRQWSDKDGHRLRKLELVFEGDYADVHFEAMNKEGNSCPTCKSMRRAYRELGKVRGVGEVVLNEGAEGKVGWLKGSMEGGDGEV